MRFEDAPDEVREHVMARFAGKGEIYLKAVGLGNNTIIIRATILDTGEMWFLTFKRVCERWILWYTRSRRGRPMNNGSSP